MPDRPLQGVLHHIRHWKTAQTAAALSDRELLDRFLAVRDEAAFTRLVERHGPMV